MTKVCNECFEEKDKDAFYLVSKRNKKTLYHICKECSNSKKAKLKRYYKDWELKAKYGISIETYEKECTVRENKCDICSKQVKTLHVDHSHKTGAVRGYLCGSCNRALGLLQDSSETVYMAFNYLLKNNT